MRYQLLLLLSAVACSCCCFQCADECLPGPVPAQQTRWLLQSLDNSGPSPVVTGSLSISRQAFGIRLSCPMDFLPADTVGADVGCGIEFYPDTPVVAVRVISLLDFGPGHPAASDVTSLFRCRVSGGQWASAPPQPATGLGYQHTQYDQIGRAVSLFAQPNPSVQADLLLISPPPAPLTAQFSIELVRRDSSVFRLKTPTLQLF